VWLSGGILGQTYILQNTITTAAGNIMAERVSLFIKQK
jgi:hypothetical protein